MKIDIKIRFKDTFPVVVEDNYPIKYHKNKVSKSQYNDSRQLYDK